MIAKTERFELRLDRETLDNVDNWRSSQVESMSRAEAIRRLVQQGLDRSNYMTMSQADILNTSLLCEIHNETVKNGELDSTFILNAVLGGHFWALNWQYTGLFHGHEDTPAAVSEVADILGMWSTIEYDLEALSDKDKAQVKEQAGSAQFRGFDGNNETEHLGVARFMINEMDRFTEFKGRDLNSHGELLSMHHRMLAVFEPMRRGMVGQQLSATQIISLLKERIHPEKR